MFLSEGNKDANASKLSKCKIDLLNKIKESKFDNVVEKIEKSSRNEDLMLSFAQQRLWFLNQLIPDSPAYNVVMAYHLSGDLNIDLLEKCISEIIRRHEILRTTFARIDGKPIQKVASDFEFKLQVRNLKCIPCEGRGNKFNELVKKESRHIFDLSRGPLLRATLFQLDEKKYVLVLNIHHIVVDGWSMGIFLRELVTLYKAFYLGEPSPLPELSIQYADFSSWQRNWLKGDNLQSQLQYWKEKLGAKKERFELQTDRQSSSALALNGNRIKFGLSALLTDLIRGICKKENVTLFMFMLAALKILFHRYTGQNDVIIGTPVANRNRIEIENLIGFFVNTLVLKTNLSGNPDFPEVLNRVRKVANDAYKHQDIPFELLVKELGADRNPNKNPLFQICFVFQNAPLIKESEFTNLNMDFSCEEVEEIFNGTSIFDMTIQIIDKDGALEGDIKYDSNIFDESTIQNIIEDYRILLEDITTKRDRFISDFRIFSEEKGKKLLVKAEETRDEQKNVPPEWNDTQVEYPIGRCIHKIFEKRAKEIPDSIAVVFEDKSLTYDELDKRSSELAAYLRANGVDADCPVAIFMQRSLDMIIGILGILKAGGAYVPLDPQYPSERLKYMIDDCGTKNIITQRILSDRISTMNLENVRITVLDNKWDLIEKTICQQQQDSYEVMPNHLAYIIYTSGSTGKPKGVMVNHENVVNTLYFMEEKYPVTENDAYLLKTNYAFDVSLTELFSWFVGRGRLVILPPNEEKSPEVIAEYIVKNQITHINFVPAMLKIFLSKAEANKRFLRNNNIKYLMIAGEAFPKELVKRAIDIIPNADVENIYGPTEASIYASWFSCSKNVITSTNTPIGKPIANTKLYILDSSHKCTPIGVPGELCIAGKGIARGYLNNPELTEERFIENPFNPGTRLYKTGDLACWLPDGNVEYLGRIDHQVKIRGFRIELGEIESRLRRYPGIQDCVVVLKEQEGNKQLIGYYVETKGDTIMESGEKNPIDSQKLRNYLKSSLPDYMIPAMFTAIDQIPLTTNGKVDRKELMNRKVIIKRTNEMSSPKSEIEKKVLEIWRSVLKNDDISVTDNFFEVGGDSLLAVSVADRIQEHFKCDFNVMTFFEHNDIRNISKYLSEYNVTSVANDSQQEDEGKEFNVYNLSSMEETEIEGYPNYYRNSVAIVGISCNFPGAKNQLDFWNNLIGGRESVRFFSGEELTELGLPAEMIKNPNYVPMQINIEGKDLFDPGFFNISPKDARLMDPQFRLLLLHSWKAIEDAGYTPEEIPETGVFMSASNKFYQALLPQFSSQSIDVLKDSQEYVSWIFAQGGTIPTMISYKLGLQGPSYFVHSNCSSSLVGLYSAYQSLRLNEAKYALVGAASVSPVSGLGYLYQPGLNFSSDGHCKAFDASADGMTGGEGVAVIMLKKTLDAINDGDNIYAIMRGISINNDGADKVGFYAPSIKGQAKVIKKVLDSTGINPETISYVEAHGTGTVLGDPIEFKALNEVYSKYTYKKQFCGIGSVKTNIGHLDTAAGLAGCIKIALSLKHGIIPPTLNFKEINPNINISESPFFIVDKLQVIDKGQNPYRAALSSFGIGGTNGHAIFEQFTCKKQKKHITSNYTYIIPLSAKSDKCLRTYARELYEFIKTTSDRNFNLADIAYTLQVGRKDMEKRAAFLVKSISEFIGILEGFAQGDYNSEGCIIGKGEAFKNNIYEIFSEDEDFKGLIGKWLARGKLKNVAELWVNGFDIDWSTMEYGEEPSRISLPAYPFDNIYCGISFEKKVTNIVAEVNTDNKQNSMKKKSEQHNTALNPAEYLTRIIKDILELSQDAKIEPEVQLMEYGMDSISGIELVEAVRRKLGLELDVRRFFSEFTLKELVKQLEELQPAISKSNETIQTKLLPWEEDKKLIDNIIIGDCTIDFKHNDKPERIFLTGVTGLVGAFLSNEILQKTNAVLYCLVRAETESLAKRRIEENLKKYELWKAEFQSRIVPILGDITKPRLGIKEEVYNELSRSIDVIYHCAAYVNHVLNYHTLKNANVEGTLSVIEFAANIRIKPIHFTSSGIVCIQANDDTLLPAHKFETELADGRFLVNGYAQTKWVSEYHLLQAQKKGIPVTIFRCGQNTGSRQSANGIVDDMYHNFLRIFSKIQAVPSYWEQQIIDIIPIDFACEAILSISLNRNCYGKIYNLINPKPIPVQEFFNVLRKRNPSILELPFEEWADCCFQFVESMPESSNKNLLLRFFEKNNGNIRVFESYFNNLHMQSDNVQCMLQEIGIEYPEINEQWWEKCINMLGTLGSDALEKADKYRF